MHLPLPHEAFLWACTLFALAVAFPLLVIVCTLFVMVVRLAAIDSLVFLVDSFVPKMERVFPTHTTLYESAVSAIYSYTDFVGGLWFAINWTAQSEFQRNI